jgi:hypothetical protein
MRTRACAVLAVLALACTAASAQQVRGMPQERAKALKPDLTAGGGNSSVGASRPSLPEEKKDRFDVLDLDGDGRISLAEAAGHADVVVHFDRADRNRDGKLTLAEYQNLGKKPAVSKKKQAGQERRRPSATARTARPQSSTSGTSSASMP